jgi:hypothetical protein
MKAYDGSLIESVFGRVGIFVHEQCFVFWKHENKHMKEKIFNEFQITLAYHS